jgi:predicted RNase H-like nuclease
MMAGPFVAGVDGCPGGWLMVLRPLDDPSVAEVRLLRAFADVLAVEPKPAMIAVDIPIGLPERIGAGGRAADVAARKVLGARQSSVFSVPSRSAVMALDYPTACARSLATSEPQRRISKQAFNIFPKIREVDALMTPEVQAYVREVHPEVAFAALNGWCPLELPKKVKSQPHAPGLASRRALLARAGYRDGLFEVPFRRKDAGPDDVLDAAVNSWTAARLLRGEARCFPEQPLVDARGLRCEIWG